MKTIPTTVTAKGTNCGHPLVPGPALTMRGLISLKPVASRMAAKHRGGMAFSHRGKKATLTSSSTLMSDGRELCPGRPRSR